VNCFKEKQNHRELTLINPQRDRTPPCCARPGYPERFVQQALGHNSKAVHHAYSKHAEVTVPSLDDWEKEWGENSQRSGQPKLLPVNFRSPLAATAQSN
jgi:hypothetical protein